MRKKSQAIGNKWKVELTNKEKGKRQDRQNEAGYCGGGPVELHC